MIKNINIHEGVLQKMQFSLCPTFFTFNFCLQDYNSLKEWSDYSKHCYVIAPIVQVVAWYFCIPKVPRSILVLAKTFHFIFSIFLGVPGLESFSKIVFFSAF